GRRGRGGGPLVPEPPRPLFYSFRTPQSIEIDARESRTTREQRPGKGKGRAKGFRGFYGQIRAFSQPDARSSSRSRRAASSSRRRARSRASRARAERQLSGGRRYPGAPGA